MYRTLALTFLHWMRSVTRSREWKRRTKRGRSIEGERPEESKEEVENEERREGGRGEERREISLVWTKDVVKLQDLQKCCLFQNCKYFDPTWTTR